MASRPTTPSPSSSSRPLHRPLPDKMFLEFPCALVCPAPTLRMSSAVQQNSTSAASLSMSRDGTRSTSRACRILYAKRRGEIARISPRLEFDALSPVHAREEWKSGRPSEVAARPSAPNHIAHSHTCARSEHPRRAGWPPLARIASPIATAVLHVGALDAVEDCQFLVDLLLFN
jgi:hypothetical protein